MSGGAVSRAHGGGGEKMRKLIGDLFLSSFTDPELAKLNDFAALNLPGNRIAMTTDSYVVDPWRFPGGNIGDIAVCGTVNDLAMSGATPFALTVGFILPEGFPLDDLAEIVKAMASRAAEAGVRIVTGDTKVVEPGCGPFVNTSGVGILREGLELGGELAKPGDLVIVSGPVGSHGIAVLSRREGIGFATEVVSDVAPLNGLVNALMAAGITVHTLRDPTRGGVAGALNEIAAQSGVEIEIDDGAVPLEKGVRGACELLGYDPLHVACEGRMLAVLPREEAVRAVEILRAQKYGELSEIIGEVRAGRPRVTARTVLGSRRLVDPPSGELLPRIC